MSGSKKILGIKQVKAISSLMGGDTITEAAENAGVTERTLYRWLSDDDFIAALRDAESQAISEATRKRISEMDENFQVMKEIRDTTRYSAANPVRLRAAALIDASAMKWRSLSNDEGRIAELEEKYLELLERVENHERSRKKR